MKPAPEALTTEHAWRGFCAPPCVIRPSFHLRHPLRLPNRRNERAFVGTFCLKIRPMPIDMKRPGISSETPPTRPRPARPFLPVVDPEYDWDLQLNAMPFRSSNRRVRGRTLGQCAAGTRDARIRHPNVLGCNWPPFSGTCAPTVRHPTGPWMAPIPLWRNC